MKLRRSQSPLLGLILLSPSALAVVLSNPTADSVAAIAPWAGDSHSLDDSHPLLQKRASADNAPVDGKDGKPHQGPFVETGEKDGSKEKTLSTGSDSTSLRGKPSDITVDEYGNKIPESNDGVMDDKERNKAREGTTGTEGGVSERARQREAEEARTGEKPEGSPILPEEKPPLPHSEEEKMKAKGIDPKGGEDGTGKKKEKSKESSKQDGLGLEKPDDLPEVPHDKDHPIPGSAVKDHLDISTGTHSSTGVLEPLPGSVDSGIIQPLHSFLLSFAMIIFSEIGDKTFLVAALMAMKHDRMVVFSAAFTALITMTVLSAVLGHAVPTLIPKSLTNFAAAVLFLVFGAKLLREGLAMDPDEGVAEEMHEVEREISEKESEAMRNGTAASAYAMEAGYARKSRSKSRLNSPPRSPSSSPEGRAGSGARAVPGGSSRLKGVIDGIHNLTSFLLSPAWVQTFVMTFLGEWGDRSQIATIAMAAGQDYWWVTIGAVLGHMCCTGVAVIGGRAIAGRVSMKVVTVGGAVAFLVFGVIYLVEGFYG